MSTPFHTSDPTEPPIPDQPTIPDAPSPGTPDDVPDIGAPEPEPDQSPGRIGDRCAPRSFVRAGNPRPADSLDAAFRTTWPSTHARTASSMLHGGSGRGKMCRVVFGGYSLRARERAMICAAST